MTPKARYRVPGFTLTEMIVATSILSLIIALALSAVVPGMKITQAAEENLSAQREVVLAFDRLVKEMTVLDRASVAVAPDILSFLSNENYSGPNSPLDDGYLLDLEETSLSNWQKQVLLHRAGGHLWRREYPYDKGDAIWRILETSLPVIVGTSASEKIYARDVELFEPIPAGRSRVYIKVRSVRRDAPKPIACELTFQVQMRGGI